MNIKINFLNGSDYWKKKVLANAEKASAILSDPRFIHAVAVQAYFDFTADTPAQVAAKLQGAGDVTISVGFYSKWWTRAIAYEANGSVYFNTRKESYGAGSPGNIAHELMHALGYSHNGNSPAGNQETVPYWVGSEIDAWVENPMVVPPSGQPQAVSA